MPRQVRVIVPGFSHHIVQNPLQQNYRHVKALQTLFGLGGKGALH